MKHWARRWLSAAGALCAASCMLQRGQWEETPANTAAPREAPSVALVLLGDAGHPGDAPGEVAEHLEPMLGAPTPPVILWLGNALAPGRGRRCPPGDPWQRNGLHELHAVVSAHLQRGGAAYAIAGPGEWRCGLVDRALEGREGGQPWAMPDLQYVVRIQPDGTTRVVSHCDPTGCRVEVNDVADALVDLVMLDITPFVETGPDGAPLPGAAESLERLEDLLTALRRDPGPPRLVVSHHPVEAAGYHGLGGGDPDATFHVLPPSLQQAMVDGLFAGILAAHDRALYATADISDAIKRTDKVWLRKPLFQVVSGAAGGADRGHRRWRTYSSIAFEPSPFAPHTGFAAVHVGSERANVMLWSRRAGRWKRSTLEVPLAPAPHPTESPSPIMDPCPRCRDLPGDAR